MKNLFVFTASNNIAKAHLRDSVVNPVNESLVKKLLGEDELQRIPDLLFKEGFYAWGAVPGSQNIKTWNAMQPEDFILIYYDKRVHYVSSIVYKTRSFNLAKEIWGTDNDGKTWEYMYFFKKPQQLKEPVLTENFDKYLHKTFQGFTKLSDGRVNKIIQDYGTLQNFIDKTFIYPIDNLIPEIIEALNKPIIIEILNEKEFYYQIAIDTLQRFNDHKEPYEGFYEELENNFSETDKKFIPFLESYEYKSEQRQFLMLVGELISYCDRHAANKNDFNQYPDKRTLAKAYVRQDDWVKNLLGYKMKGNQSYELNPSIRNAIHYLMNPERGLTMLSENHRKLLVQNLIKKQYQEDSFIDDVLTFFKPYKIQPENPLNYTNAISNILYLESVKKLWKGNIDDDEPDDGMRDITEKGLVHHVHRYLTSIGFRYQYDEIANFYLALRTKPFVILAGISGTGKTQLPRKLAEALGFSDKQVFLVPVRPDWTDGSDLLGYTSLNNQFIPKDLTQAIQVAQKNKDEPHFFILDEMNLARVEHYFSDFLSVIETRKRNNGKIETQSILRSETLTEAGNKGDFDSILWPENLFLIGTVNMDETTFTFSRKVLDRANTIEMNDIDLNWIEPSVSNIDPLNNVKNGIFSSMYLSPLEFSDEDKESISGEMKLLIEVNETLRAADLHFAYRVRDEIAYYLIMNQKFELMSQETAMDFQFVQKILPRIHGSSERVQNVLIELLNILEDLQICTRTYEYSNLEEKLKSHEFKYKRTADKIRFMLKRFDEDRFTSFWL